MSMSAGFASLPRHLQAARLGVAARLDRLTGYSDYGRLLRVYGRSVIRYGGRRKILNALRTEWAYRRRRRDVASSPYVLFVEPLYYCNLKCPLCDRERFRESRRDDPVKKLPPDLFDKLLDEVGDYLFQCLIFGLGEPLLDWPLTRDVIRKAHDRRIFTLVSTNCTLVTPTMADEIVTSGLDYLVCAIDGVSQEAYGAYRIRGDADKALEGLRMLAEARRRSRSLITIEWQYLVNRHNQHEMDRARKIARELGVYLRFAPIGGMGSDEGLQRQWLPRGPRYQDGAREDGSTRFKWPCYWLWRAIVLNSNGRLARCPGYQSIAEVGDLRADSVRDVYDGPVTRRARQLFSKRPVAKGDFPLPCDRCSFYPRCHGGPAADKPEVALLIRQQAATRQPVPTVQVLVRKTKTPEAGPLAG